MWLVLEGEVWELRFGNCSSFKIGSGCLGIKKSDTVGALKDDEGRPEQEGSPQPASGMTSASEV